MKITNFSDTSFPYFTSPEGAAIIYEGQGKLERNVFVLDFSLGAGEFFPAMVMLREVCNRKTYGLRRDIFVCSYALCKTENATICCFTV